MASWITHLMIADGVLHHFPSLDRRGFCVGNIAPDCNMENEDWTSFTPPREVTHWMQAARKKSSDCDLFCEEYIIRRRNEISSAEEYAFLLGYYSHLITDVAFQAMTRNSNRIKAAWSRIRIDEEYGNASIGMEETWDGIKMLIPKKERMRQIYAIEWEYLRDHPDSGYLTEILPLKNFPDYIDYLPAGAIVRKIGVMGYLSKPDESGIPFLAITRDEYQSYVSDTTQKIIDIFTNKDLL